MALNPLNLFKLEKLKIKAYKSVERGMGDLVGTFEAMFNPASFTQKYDIKYKDIQEINSEGKQVEYVGSPPTALDIKLTLDGTRVHQMGIRRLQGMKSVSERVQAFLDLAYHMNGVIHEPNYLVLQWGSLNFPCRLGCVNVTYTSFNRDGTPLRAELDAKFLADVSDKKRTALENKSSPDLTHTRIVRSGDTLPLLTKEIYGSSAFYVQIAQVNGLDNFRTLTPGQELFFPPLDQ